MSEPYDGSLGLAENTRRGHLFEVERFTFLAESGFLTDAELEKIAAEGREARERIGTDPQQTAPLSPDYGGDKLTAARADGVLFGSAALHGKQHSSARYCVGDVGGERRDPARDF